MEEITTISVRPETKEKLEKLKIHPNQSFDEILCEIISLVGDKFTKK